MDLLYFVVWLLLAEIIGLAALPVAFRVLHTLPDRGYTLSKALGIILPSYVFWLVGMLGILQNSRASIVIVFFLFGLASWWWAKSYWGEMGQHFRQHRRFVITAELLFIIALASATLFKAYNPAITATEKPMEIAFLNATLRSENLPPLDPWMSGHSISYYYFGYVMIALLTKVSGIPSSYTFNLAIALLFALTVLGSFGLVYNLVVLTAERLRRMVRRPALWGLVGAVFVALLGNLEGVWEVLHSNRLLSTDFWRWLGIAGLETPYRISQLFPTDPPDTWWWWRASRVIATVDPATNRTLDYTINEFPFFSFLLGDLHPHVLALPFVLLALGFGLALVHTREILTWHWLRSNWPSVAIAVVVFGGLGFLNSWDMPTYLLVLALCFAIQRALTDNLALPRLLLEASIFGLAMLVLGFIFYLPFYYGFSSQASGIGIVFTRSRLPQFLTIWAPFLAISGPYAAVALWRAGRGLRALSPAWSRPLAAIATTGLVGLMAFFWLVLRAEVAALLLALLALAGGGLLVTAIGSQRGMPLPLACARGQSGNPTTRNNPAGAVKPNQGIPGSALFTTALAAVGFFLLFVCEFVFIRDTFGNRMNTVFKFYYQAWVLLAVSSAYGLYYLSTTIKWDLLLSRITGGAWLIGVTLLILGALIYPLIAPSSKANGFRETPTLDGTKWIKGVNPADYDAIKWLQDNVDGTPVLLEASGPQYSYYNRVASFTGLPTVLGWLGHELQWRGTAEEASRRKGEIDTIYRTTDISLAQRLLDKYRISYVYIGDLERQAYADAPPRALAKFGDFMEAAYKNDRAIIYRTRPGTGAIDGSR